MAYTRVNWQNSPSHATPLSAENLNVMDAAIEELDGAVTDAEGTISTLESTVSDQATTISGLQTTVGEHTADIGNMEDDISDLQTTVSGHTTSIGNLETAVGTNTEDITDLKEDLDNAVSDIANTINGNDLDIHVKYVQGSVSVSGSTAGNITSNAKRIATKDLIDVSGIDTLNISVAEGYRIYLIWYNDDGTYKVGRGWYTGTFSRPVEANFLRYTFATVGDETALTPESFADSMLSITYEPHTRIDDIAEYVGYVKAIPEYWNSALTTAISSIHTQEETTDAQGDSFVFITDTHWTKNAQHSPELIKRILQKTNVRNVFFGGDVLTLYSTKAEALTIGRSFYGAFGDATVFSVLGNHDINNNQSTYGQEAYLTYPQVYSYMFKKGEPWYTDMPKWNDTNGDVNRNFYYYIDNKTQKIRYIVLNNARARIGTVQTSWLKAKLTEMPTGWTAIIFAHEYWFGLNGTTPIEVTYGTDVESAINEVYDSLSGTVGALIVGHCHYDYSKVAEKGYPIISTTTDAYELSDTPISPSMTLGTNTEQAFDVFSIDTKNRKIYATRVGAGSDREFSY